MNDRSSWKFVKICLVPTTHVRPRDAECFLRYPKATNSTCCHLKLECKSTELDHTLCVRVICDCPNRNSVVPGVATVLLLQSSRTSEYCRSLRQCIGIYHFAGWVLQCILLLMETLQYLPQLHCNSSISTGGPYYFCKACYDVPRGSGILALWCVSYLSRR